MRVILIFILVAKTPDSFRIRDLWVHRQEFESIQDCEDAAQTMTSFDPEKMYVCKDRNDIRSLAGYLPKEAINAE